MIGEILNKASLWFEKAVKFEQEGKDSMSEKCLNAAIKYEKEAIAAGESWT